MKKAEVIFPEFEVTVISKTAYKITQVVNARNEYEAVLEMANSLSGDFDYFFSDGDYEVSHVVRTD